MTNDPILASTLSMARRLRADAYAEYQDTYTEAREKFHNDPEFHARTTMLRDTLELVGRIVDTAECLEIMAALVMVERRTQRFREQSAPWCPRCGVRDCTRH